MGKTSMPLDICVTQELLDTPEVRKLIEQGHNVMLFPLLRPQPNEGVDMLLHPRAWNMHHEYMDYLPVALKAARAKRYPKRAKREPKASKKKKATD